MVLMLFTLGRYLEAAGRARASRDLAPLLAAERELATVVEGGQEHRRPVREVRAGMLIRVRPGERIPVDGLIVEGRSHTDDAVITGESRQIAKRSALRARGQHQSRRSVADSEQRIRRREPLGADLPIGP